jgi:hypothetical protein
MRLKTENSDATFPPYCVSEHCAVSHGKIMCKNLTMNLWVITVLIQRCRKMSTRICIGKHADGCACVTFYQTNKLLSEISFRVIFVWYMI